MCDFPVEHLYGTIINDNKKKIKDFLLSISTAAKQISFLTGSNELREINRQKDKQRHNPHPINLNRNA